MTSPRRPDERSTNPRTSHEPAAMVAADRAGLLAAEFAEKPTSLTGGQHERSAVAWAHGADGARAGFWGCEPGAFTAVRDRAHEVCYILSGRATVREASGEVAEVGPGTLLVLADGWEGTWEVHEPIEKVFVVIPS